MEPVDEMEVFAEEIFTFVLTECRYHRGSRNLGKDDPNSVFTNTVRLAVRYYLRENEKEVKNIFNTLLGHGNLNARFQEFSTDITKEVFVRGYSPREFVQFCTIMCRLAVLCYYNNFGESLTYAIKSILDIIQLFMKTGQLTPDALSQLSRETLIP